MGGAVAGLVASNEERYKKLEAKDYLIDRNPNFVERVYEYRVKSIYLYAPRTFKLVLRDRVKIAQEAVVGFAENE